MHILLKELNNLWHDFHLFFIKVFSYKLRSFNIYILFHRFFMYFPCEHY